MIGHDLFADPAWDILLDLFASQAEGGAVSISSACIASGCPTSTALFWIGRLEETGLVTRRPDPKDRRRKFVEITGDAFHAVEEWLVSVF